MLTNEPAVVEEDGKVEAPANPLYQIQIVGPYPNCSETITCTAIEHAVRMAIACISLGSHPRYPQYRPVVEVTSNQFQEDFGIYMHTDLFCIDSSMSEGGGDGEKDEYGNFPSEMSPGAYDFYSLFLESIASIK